MRFALLTALVLSLAGCVEEPTLGETSEHVIGGTRTPDGQYPQVGALIYNVEGQLVASCTGTLIAPDVVLTAAHCVDPVVTGGLQPISFTLNHDTTISTQPSTPVASTMKHEQFDINRGTGSLDVFYDIGLVFLATPVAGVTPMKMPTPSEAKAITIGTDLELVGYGRTIDADANSAGVMYDARTKIVDLVRTEMRVSMGTPDPQNCHGDSGGPALATLGGGQRIVGIVSRSFESSACDNGGVDTRVDAYLRWIDDNAPGVPCGSGLACYDDGGCCSTGGASQGSLLLGAAVGAMLVRRRRRA